MPVGDLDRATSRRILQPITDYRQGVRLAEDSGPALSTDLRSITSDIPGARLRGVRVKGIARLEEKIAAGKPPATISDYLGGRIEVDSVGDANKVAAALHARYRVLDDENFLDRPKIGYRARHLQVQLKNGLSAEVQLVPREIAQVQDEAHRHYEGLRSATATLQQHQAATAASARIFDAAWERFQARASGRG